MRAENQAADGALIFAHPFSGILILHICFQKALAHVLVCVLGTRKHMHTHNKYQQQNKKQQI